MLDLVDALPWLALAIPGLPLAVFVGIGVVAFFFGPPSERSVHRPALLALFGSTLALAILAGSLARSGARMIEVPIGTVFASGEYRFVVAFLVDPLSLAFAASVAVIALLVGRFAVNYLHRELGYARFFALLSLCASGLFVLSLAASYDVLFVGWEMVGLSSVLLVMFFHDRPGPAQAGLRVFTTYRVADIGLLCGVVVLHQAAGTTDYEAVFDQAAWPAGAVHIGEGAATIVALCLLLSAMGKSAQFPLGGWLPRAMEGPTPSSALFYGALSIHGGVYLLLRSSPLLDRSAVASAAVLVVGALTAGHAALVGRVQTDAKSQMAYATMAQLGIMFVEIGLGLRTLVVVHMVAHAFLRGFQLLRAPSAIADIERIRAALQGRALQQPTSIEHRLPAALRGSLYRLALDRFHLDALLDRAIVAPVLRASRALAALELAVTNALAGANMPPSGHTSRPAPRARRAERAAEGAP